MLAVFDRIAPTLRKSITFDNDTAFAQHGLLTTMRAMTTWFCDAYASWQKGEVENANGRLRRWLPRHIDIDKVSDEEIQACSASPPHNEELFGSAPTRNVPHGAPDPSFQIIPLFPLSTVAAIARPVALAMTSLAASLVIAKSIMKGTSVPDD